MFNKRSSKQAAVVGLELDPSHIAAAVASANGSVSLTRGAVSELPPASSVMAKPPTPWSWPRS